jgi:MFS family permease
VSSSASASDVPSLSRKDKIVNFIICMIDAVGFPAGIAFFAERTIIPTFLDQCGASKVLIGALLGVASLLQLGLGLFVIQVLGKQKRLKFYLFWVALFERLCLLPLVFLAPLWGETNKTLLILAMFLCYGGHSACMGVNIPAYWTVVAKTVPAHWRGRMFGVAGGIAGVMGFGTEWFLEHVVLAGPNRGFPSGYGHGFHLGFWILTLSIIPFLWLREPESVPEPESTLAENAENTENRARPLLDIAALKTVWRNDHRFRRFAQSLSLFMLCNMAAAFFVLDAQTRFGTGANVALYTAIGVVVGSLGSLIIGWLADKCGNLRMVLVSCGLALGAFIVALSAPSGLVYAGVFALWALSVSGLDLTAGNFMMEMAGKSERIPLYSALFNIVRVVPKAIAPLVGGFFVEQFGQRPLMWICCMVCIASLLLLVRARTDA